MCAVLRVCGPELDLDRCLGWIPTGALERAWRVGDRTGKGEASTTSGFVVVMSDTEDRQQLVKEALATFLRIAPKIRALVETGASADMDFGLMVGPVLPSALSFEPAFLRALEENKVRLLVTAYPTSEDEDED